MAISTQVNPNIILWTYDDGGRKKFGYQGSAGNCACRAISIATGLSYQRVYDLILEAGQKKSRVYMSTMKKIMAGLGRNYRKAP